MNLSLCCISNILAEEGHKFRTMTFKSFSSKSREESLEKLSNIIANNFSVSEKIIRHCAAVGIRGYRISSDLTPVINHPDVNICLEDLPNFELINFEILKLKTAIEETGIRVSAHPSEYISLTSEDEKVLINSIKDLEQHAEIFERLGLEKSYYNPLNIHIRKEGDPENLCNIFMKNFERLSDGVKSRLVLENNDTGSTWDVAALKKYFYHNHNIPVTFDNLHHKMLNNGVSEIDAFHNAYETWGDIIPIFHYSEGKDNGRAHKDMAEHLPENFGKEVYFDVELKNKDIAILDILRRLENDN
jgi:UV DNA damage endonuclease